MTRSKTHLLASIASTLAATALIVPASARAAQGMDRRVDFAIAPTGLREGISAFSRATGLQVILAPGIAQGRRTAGVSGSHTVREALTVLLRGTGLSVSVHGNLAILTAGASPEQRAIGLQREQGDPGEAAPASNLASKTADANGDDIVVQGYRKSLQRAQDLKRKAVNSEDDILAQDIAAFPDLNLAESLQRIPGITITRDSGEGRQITLRGLGPDFTRTQLNGMEVLGNTASGMDNRGNVSRTRSFDYSLFASELFNRVSVQKSFSAEQDEGGIAGTVELYTAKPFDYDGDKFVVSAKGQTNTNTDGVTPRAVALASKRFGDFGALVSVAYGEIKSNEYGYRNWGWSQVHYNAANVGPGVSAADAARLEATGAARLFTPQAQSPSTWWTDRKRFGVTTALQYHPSARFHLDLDLLYGRLSDHRDDYAIASAGTNALTGDVVGTQVIQSAAIQGNSLVAGSYTGVDFRTEHHTVRNHTDFYQGVLSGDWQPFDRLKITALGGYEESDFAQPEFDKVFLEAKNQGFSFDMRPTTPVNTYAFDVANAANWQLMRLDTQENTITNQYANGKLEAAYKLDGASTFKVGGSFKHFVNAGYTYGNKVFRNVPTDTVIPDSLKTVIDKDSLLPYIGGDVAGTFAYVGQIRDLTAANLNTGSDFRVSEKTWDAFAQYDLDTHIFGIEARANAGVRYYSTDLISSGRVGVGTTTVILTPVAVENNSHGLLPSANIALNLAHDLIFRASASRNVNRPALGDIAATGTVASSPFSANISVGNPNLKPFKATSAEGSIEYYFGHAGYVSLAGFYKDMDSFITTSTSAVPYSATGYPLSLLLPGQTGDLPVNFSRPINGPGATIKGVEASIQHDFDFLPAPLNHLGVVANGTYFNGHQTVVINGASVQVPLFNLSKWAANATLYYEDTNWGVRVSEAYRSRYLINAGSNGNVGEGIRATSNIDFSGHLNITTHIKAVVEGINLTDQAITQFTDLTADRILVRTTSGRTFTFGVSAEF